MVRYEQQVPTIFNYAKHTLDNLFSYCSYRDKNMSTPTETAWREKIVKCFYSELMSEASENEDDIELFDTKQVIDKIMALLTAATADAYQRGQIFEVNRLIGKKTTLGDHLDRLAALQPPVDNPWSKLEKGLNSDD